MWILERVKKFQKMRCAYFLPQIRGIGSYKPSLVHFNYPLWGPRTTSSPIFLEILFVMHQFTFSINFSSSHLKNVPQYIQRTGIAEWEFRPACCQILIGTEVERASESTKAEYVFTDQTSIQKLDTLKWIAARERFAFCDRVNIQIAKFITNAYIKIVKHINSIQYKPN